MSKDASGLTWREVETRSGVCTKEFYGAAKAHKKGFRRTTIQTLADFFEAPELADACSDDLYWDTIVSIDDEINLLLSLGVCPLDGNGNNFILEFTSLLGSSSFLE